MDDHQKQFFHSSDIADNTLAGSTADPFILTDKEKKKAIQKAKHAEQKVHKIEQKLHRKTKNREKIEKLKEWQKKHRILSVVVPICCIFVLGLGIFSLTKYISSILSKNHSSLFGGQTKPDVDSSDPLSIRCQCSKNSELYKQLKAEDEESQNFNNKIISDFDPKTAMPSRYYQFIYSVLGTSLSNGAIDKNGKIDLQTMLNNIESSIASSKITDQDKLRVLKIYSINAYLEVKDYEKALSLLAEYEADNLYSGEKAVFYNIYYKIYTALGDQTAAKNVADILNSIPDEPFQS